MKNRFIFNNLIYKRSKNQFILFNLFSYRRTFISSEELTTLFSIESKINSGCMLKSSEATLYDRLVAHKQILDDFSISNFEARCEAETKSHDNMIPIRSIMINITYSCNFSCAYCYQNPYKHHQHYAGTMSFEDIDDIIEYIGKEEFHAAGLTEVVISGGEPLLLNNVKLIEYIVTSFRNRYSNLKISIYTNGENITRLKDQINFNQIDHFQISLDGPDRILKSVNGINRSAYNSVIDGIKYLKSIGRSISIISMLTPELEDTMDEFFDALKKDHVMDNGIPILVNVVHDYYGNNLTEVLRVAKKVHQLKGKYKFATVGFQSNSEIERLSSLLRRSSNTRINPIFRTCDIVKTIPIVFSVDGNVHWCSCVGTEMNRIGCFRGDSFIDKKKLNEFLLRTIFTVEKCKQCKFRYICGGGCVLDNISRNRPINSANCGVFGSSEFWDNLEDYI